MKSLARILHDAYRRGNASAVAWEYLIPAQHDGWHAVAREERKWHKQYRFLSELISVVLAEIDKTMKMPDGKTRGERIAWITNHLELQRDLSNQKVGIKEGR